MGIYVIRVPDIGEGIAEVELVTWNVQPGDSVTEDQHLADVMTDKATVEVPSPVHGKVISLGGAVGQVMAVGAELVRLEVEGEGNLKENSASEPASKAQAAPVLVAAPAPVAKRGYCRGRYRPGSCVTLAWRALARTAVATARRRIVPEVVEHIFLRRRCGDLEFAPPFGQALQFVVVLGAGA